MSTSELINMKNLNNSNSKESLIEEKEKKPKKEVESPKSKNSTSPKDSQKQIPIVTQNDFESDFGLTFKEIYNVHMTEIESKTNLNRKYIYAILIISLFFFLIGHLQRTCSYLITFIYPLKWTFEDFKSKKENFGKKWGTYWGLFCIFVFFDVHKREVLKIIPLYFIVKTVFLVILCLPGFPAAVNLYDGLFKEIFQSLSIYIQNKEESDILMNDVKNKVKIKKE